jgi:hypothetical protein
MNERTDTIDAGFIRLRRGPETLELLKDRNAFILLTVIALQAGHPAEFNVNGVKPRQARLGDCRAYGMTRQQYRGAKHRLKKWSLANFRPTRRGTVATLLNGAVYDIEGASNQMNQKNTVPKDPLPTCARCAAIGDARRGPCHDCCRSTAKPIRVRRRSTLVHRGR